jgi:antitoxin (DNA-binding transcriptional repressor) of toxin-antitoxin stability system
VEELTHHASQVLADVEKHCPCIVTVSGRPVATRTPTSLAHRWVPTTEMAAVFAHGAGAQWDDSGLSPRSATSRSSDSPLAEQGSSDWFRLVEAFLLSVRSIDGEFPG